MNANDLIGAGGVFLVLVAYFANAWGFMKQGQLYFALNTVGGALSCAAALLIPYWPFVVLEGIWTLVSIIGWIRAARKKENPLTQP